MPQIRNRGLYFDLAVFLGNLFLLPFMGRLMQEKPGGGVLLLAAFAAQAAGAYLKRPGLQTRIADRDYFKGKTWTQFFGGSSIVLLILHYLVFCCAFTFGVANVLPEGFQVEAYENHPAYVPVLILLMIVASIPTILAARALMPYKPDKKPAQGSGNGAEPVADILLYFSVEAMVSFWSGLFLKTIYDAPQEGGFHPIFAIAMSLLIALPFFMFYVMPRLLFLVEDSMYVGTWIRMFLAMLPVSYHLLKG